MRWCLTLSIAICLALFGFTGCKKQRFASLSTQELEVAKHALSLSDISLMLRSGSNQHVIVSEIQKRHVASALDSSTEAQLRRNGAHSEVIVALKNPVNVLTAGQAVAYAASRTQSGTTSDDAAKPDPASNIFSGNDPLADGRSKTRVVSNSRETSLTSEERVDANERAEAAYRSRKQVLEKQIATQESAINRLRSYGHDESAMASATQLLEDYKQQLANLPPPALR